MKYSNDQVLSAMVESSLRLQPPIVRSAILNDEEFPARFGIGVRGGAYLRQLGVTISRSDLYKAFRSVDSEGNEVIITDYSGGEWRVARDAGEAGWPAIQLSNGNQQLVIRDLFPLCDQSDSRLSCFAKITRDIYLPAETRQKWMRVLKKRPATETEMERWHEEVQAAPQSLARGILRDTQTGDGNLDTLIPRSKVYFERLVGKYDTSRSIQEFAKGSWLKHSGEVAAWLPYEGFLQNLYSAGHASMTSQITSDGMNSEDLGKAFAFLVEDGDYLSKLGGIEIGMRILPNHPGLESMIYRLIEQMSKEDAASPESGFVVLSRFFELIDGVLSTRCIFRSEPPFYRRLVSLAHAALVQRQLKLGNVDMRIIVDWSKQFGNIQFHCQSLTDMRVEPRWIPGFSNPSQLKAEFMGRIMNAARHHEDNVRSTSIHELVIGDGPDSVPSNCDLPLPFLPGPLEGNCGSGNQMPPEFREAIDEQLANEEPTASSFVALVNGSLLFQMEKRDADLAAKLLNEGKHRIRDLSNKGELLDILNGLGMAAAVSGSESLRQQVLVLVRRYRRGGEFALEIGEAVCICLMASAANDDSNEWCEAVGSWITELAFSDLTSSEALELFAYLETLLKITPALWSDCGRAHAALQTIKSSDKR